MRVLSFGFGIRRSASVALNNSLLWTLLFPPYVPFCCYVPRESLFGRIRKGVDFVLLLLCWRSYSFHRVKNLCGYWLTLPYFYVSSPAVDFFLLFSTVVLYSAIVLVVLVRLSKGKFGDEFRICSVFLSNTCMEY